MQITDFYGSFGLATVFAVVLLQQLGAPIPALPVLVLAGAKAMDDPLHGISALAVAVVASSIGNLAWYWAGRRHGYRVLKLLCRMTLSPDSCVRTTETAFERHGVASLVAAKFVPGLSRVAPPLAGALRIRVAPFLIYSGVGTALWAASGLIAGLVFYRQIDGLLDRPAAMGGVALVVVGALLVMYVAWRLLDRWRFLRSLRAASIGVHELYELIAKGDEPVILDVRSKTHRSLDARSIPGARPVDPDRLEETLRSIRRVRPLAGGIDAWFDAGLTLERRPSLPG